jgi:hypothetical protein
MVMMMIMMMMMISIDHCFWDTWVDQPTNSIWWFLYVPELAVDTWPDSTQNWLGQYSWKSWYQRRFLVLFYLFTMSCFAGMGILAMFRNERWNNYATSHFDRIDDWHFWFPREVIVRVMMIASLEHTLQTPDCLWG